MKLAIELDIDPVELHRQRLLLCYIEKYDIKGGPITGLLNLTDAIADHMSDWGEKGALLAGTTQEHELGQQYAAQLAANVREVTADERLNKEGATNDA